MKETTKTILSALATADRGEIVDLPIGSDLYPEASLQAAEKAFQSHCLIERQGQGKVTVRVSPNSVGRSREILGAFLNYLLCDAILRNFREDMEDAPLSSS